MKTLIRLAATLAVAAVWARMPAASGAPPVGTGLDAHAAEIHQIEQPRIAGGEGNSGRTLEQMMKDLTNRPLIGRASQIKVGFLQSIKRRCNFVTESRVGNNHLFVSPFRRDHESRGIAV